MTEPSASAASAPAVSPIPASSVPSVQAQVDAVMNLDAKDRAEHPYWNERHPGHKAAVDAMYELRQAQGAVEGVQAAAKDPHVEGFAPGADPEMAQTEAGDYTAVPWPKDFTPEGQRYMAKSAQDVGIGATELSAIAKAATPLLGDGTDYSYEQGATVLRKQLGDDYEPTLRLARQYVQEHPGLETWLKQARLLNHPAAVKVLADRMLDRASAQEELDAIMADPAYFGGTDHAKSKQLAERAYAIRRRLAE